MRLPMTGLYVYPSFPDVRVGILPIFFLGPDCGIRHPHETVSDVLCQPALRGDNVAVPYQLFNAASADFVA